MANTAVSAKNAKVRIGATVLYAAKWTVSNKGQKLDRTNFESAGYGEYVGGILDADVTIEGPYNVGDGPIAVAPPGTSISTVKLYLNDTTGVFWSFPSLYVETFEVSAEVRGLVTLKITGSGNGTFSGPTG